MRQSLGEERVLVQRLAFVDSSCERLRDETLEGRI